MTNEVQRFDILGSPGSGKFTLSFRDSEPTTDIAHHPPAGDVQRALEALSTVGIGNVMVSKDGNWGYVCAFGSALADQDLPLLVADDSALGGGATIEVSVVTEGMPPDVPPEVPPDTLPTPCTLQDLLNFVQQALPRGPSSHHQVKVSSSDTSIWLHT
jgi:hypothetical protein